MKTKNKIIMFLLNTITLTSLAVSGILLIECIYPVVSLILLLFGLSVHTFGKFYMMDSFFKNLSNDI